MFYGENIEENIDFILTFLPTDFAQHCELDSISNHISWTLTNSERNTNTTMFRYWISQHRQICHYINDIIMTYVVASWLCNYHYVPCSIETSSFAVIYGEQYKYNIRAKNNAQIGDSNL